MRSALTPKIAAPIARRRAQVDAGTRIRRSDPNDDIVSKAHPAAFLARFDSARRLVGRDDRPAHLLGCLECSGECRIGLQPDDQRRDVRISSPLLLGYLGALIGTELMPSPCRNGTTATKAGGLSGSVVMSWIGGRVCRSWS